MINRNLEAKLWFIGTILYASTHMYCRFKDKHFIHVWYSPNYTIWMSTIVLGLMYNEYVNSLK